MVFPSLEAHDLNGRAVVVPEELSGVLNVVLLAFHRAHSAVLATWHELLLRLKSRHPGLEFWEIPVLSSSYRIWQPFIDSGMRAGTPDPAARRRTLTTYTSLKDLANRLQLPGLETIASYLLAAGGEILWHRRGPCSPDSFDSLAAAVDTGMRANAVSHGAGEG